MQALERAIAESRARYEADQHNADVSASRASEWQTLCEWRGFLQNGEPSAALREKLAAALPGLKEELAREAEHPSFDWYDEHYHYKRLAGVLDAYRIVLPLLEPER